MIIVLKPNTGKPEAEEILNQIEKMGLKPLYMPGVERTVIGALGDERKLGQLHLESHPAVERVDPILAPYKAVSREMHPENSIVVDHARIDRGALDDRPIRCEVTTWKAGGTCHSKLARPLWRHNHIIRVDRVLVLQVLAQSSAAR